MQPIYKAVLGVIGMDHLKSELCIKVTILQRNYMKITIFGHFPIHVISLCISMVKYLGATA